MYRILLLGPIILISCNSKIDADKLKFLKRGNQAYENNSLKDAIRFYNDALAKDSLYVDAWNNKGLVLMKQNK